MKVLILDDHNLFSQGLSKIISDSFTRVEVFVFNSIKQVSENQPNYLDFDLLISDIELPGEDIFVYLNYIKLNFPDLPVLVVSMHNKLSIIRKCRELEIEGYILKDDYLIIKEVVNSLLRGDIYYSEKVLKTLDILEIKENILTPKEEEIIKLLAKGSSNQEIADELFISYNTIKTHRKNISRKLELNSVAEIVKYYYENYL